MTNDPSLDLLWDAFTGYQRTAAIKAAIELDVFTLIVAGSNTVEGLVVKTKAAARGLRALLNYLVGGGLLSREGDVYGVTPTAAMFLDRSSPAFIGSAITFLASSRIMESFANLTEAVRRGGTAVSPEGTLSAEDPIWVDFARAMGPLAAFSGSLLGNLLDIENSAGGRILDIAAGHGMFGIALAKLNPRLEVTALDWRNVLQVAEENARAAGVSDRFHLLPGSAFEVAFPDPCDLILLPNFLHHFDPTTCEQILAKAQAALAAEGRVVIVEFIPNDDRMAPTDAVQFALVMLATTPSGDAYTFGEYTSMLEKAGFKAPTLHDLLPSPSRVVIASRQVG